VAVALRSSTIWQRLDLGLDRSFIYAFEDPALGNLLPEAIGEYQRNVFRSDEDLFAKLDACWADDASPPAAGETGA
jgi:RecA-family ATPase